VCEFKSLLLIVNMPVGSEAQQQIDVKVTNVPEEVIQEAGEDLATLLGSVLEAKIFVSRLITKTYA